MGVLCAHRPSVTMDRPCWLVTSVESQSDHSKRPRNVSIPVHFLSLSIPCSCLCPFPLPVPVHFLFLPSSCSFSLPVPSRFLLLFTSCCPLFRRHRKSYHHEHSFPFDFSVVLNKSTWHECTCENHRTLPRSCSLIIIIISSCCCCVVTVQVTPGQRLCVRSTVRPKVQAAQPSPLNSCSSSSWAARSRSPWRSVTERTASCEASTHTHTHTHTDINRHV